MPIADTSSVNAEGNLSGIDADVLTAKLQSAEIELRSIITDEEYARIAALVETHWDYIRLKKAESLMTIYFLLPALNIELDADGHGVIEYAYSSDGGDLHMSLEDVQELADRYYEQALQCIAWAIQEDEFEFYSWDEDWFLSDGVSMHALTPEASASTNAGLRVYSVGDSVDIVGVDSEGNRVVVTTTVMSISE